MSRLIGSASVAVTRARLALGLAALLVLLLGAEGALRALGHRPFALAVTPPKVDPPGPFYRVDPVLGYALRPGRFTVTLPSGGTFVATHDSAGRRVVGSAPRAEPGQGTSARDDVWIFGCSYTYGWSVEDDEAYPSQLQRLLPGWRVVNFGVGGYGTVQSLLQLESALEADEAPRVVVLAYASFHDRRNTFLRGRRKALAMGNFIRADTFPYARLSGDSVEIGYAALEYAPWPLMRHSSLVNLADSATNRLGELIARSHLVSLRLVLRARDVAARHGSDFVLAGITDDSTTRETLALAESRGIRTVDISTDLSLPGARNRPHSWHPSAASHRRYAEALAANLARDAERPGREAR